MAALLLYSESFHMVLSIEYLFLQKAIIFELLKAHKEFGNK